MKLPSAPDRPPRDRLPRDRDLPDPQQRLDRIIQEAGRPPVRRRRYLYLAAAAAAVIIVLITIGSLTLPSRPSVVASPSPPPPTAVTPTGAVHRIGDRVVLRDVTVTVREVRQDRDGLAVVAQTCFTGATAKDEAAAIDRSRWQAVTARNTYAAEDFPSFDRKGQSAWPVYPTDPPTGRTSSCVEGWLPFAGLGPEDERVMISFHDRLGESAQWMIR